MSYFCGLKVREANAAPRAGQLMLPVDRTRIYDTDLRDGRVILDIVRTLVFSHNHELCPSRYILVKMAVQKHPSSNCG